MTHFDHFDGLTALCEEETKQIFGGAVFAKYDGVDGESRDEGYDDDDGARRGKIEASWKIEEGTK